jgi:Tfp pilus assembly protein PilF
MHMTRSVRRHALSLVSLLAVGLAAVAAAHAQTPELRALLGECAQHQVDACTAVLQSDDPKIHSEYILANRGLGYAERGDFAAAIHDYDQALLAQPGDPRLYENRALIYEAAGQPDLAARDYARAKFIREDR